MGGQRGKGEWENDLETGYEIRFIYGNISIYSYDSHLYYASSIPLSMLSLHLLIPLFLFHYNT